MPDLIPLTSDEQQRRTFLEQEIVQWDAKSFVIGRAIHEIAEAKLYRDTHKTFEEYILDCLGWTRGHAYNLIAASKTYDLLSSTAVVPTSEFQLRPLISLPSDKQKAVWEAAIKAAAGKRITHDLVQEMRDEIAGSSHAPQFHSSAQKNQTKAEVEEIEDAYINEPVEQALKRIPQSTIDLLLVSNLKGKAVADTTAELDRLLTTILPTLKRDANILVFAQHHDIRDLLQMAETHGFEIGTPFYWMRGTTRQELKFSFLTASTTIIHFRHGKGRLYDPIPNVLHVDDESPKVHDTQRPIGLLSELIASAVAPGATVLDPTAGIGSTLVACRQIGRRCIAIEPNKNVYDKGLKYQAKH